MENNAQKILDVLPFDGGLTESQIVEILQISHGTFFYSIQSLLDAGSVAFRRENRAKYYYRVGADDGADGGANTDKPLDSESVNNSVSVKKSDKKKVQAIINADYDDKFQGIFPTKQAFLDVVCGIDGYITDWEDVKNRRIFVNVEDSESGESNILRYDYDRLPSGAFEVWRYRIHQTYKRRGA